MAKTALTAESVLMRCKVDRLENVQKMNVWGSNIEDVRVLRNMPNLEVVSLSVNKISSLKDFQYCQKMKELYLRKNLIADLNEVRYLQGMSGLKVLWLLENPCAEQPNYRLLVIKMLPSLDKLDNQAVTPEERTMAGGVADEGQRPQGSPPRREVSRPKTIESAASRPVDRPSAERPPPERPAPAAFLERPAVDLERAGGPIPRPGSSSAEKPTPPPDRQPVSRARGEQRPPVTESKNENLICAILALVKELDEQNLELVRKEIEKRMAGR